MDDSFITIVGAGPVGSLLALLLARRGLRVQVYERRPDLRSAAISAGRSINLAVSTRALHALHEVGLDREVLERAVPMFGRMLHSPAGGLSFLRYGSDDREFINSMSRGELNRLLISRAERAGARFHFQERLAGYDFATREAWFRSEADGREARVPAPVIVGTDGSASALRTAMGEADTSITTSSEVLDFGYKELTMPPAQGGKSRFAMEENALHIWPRGRFMLIALPNIDGSFTCTLFLPFEAPAGEPSFATLQSSAEVRDFFAACFADSMVHIPGLEEQFLAAPLGKMGTVKASQWSYGSALLLGDAAHAIVPFFGQGMNAGFEDCTLLDALLDGDGRTDWAALFEAFWRARKTDTDAIADLAVENFVEMRDKVADPEFLLWKAVETELQKRLGARYRSRYQLVTFSRVPYRLALEAGRAQQSVLRELCAGKTRADQIDYARAEQLVAAMVEPLLLQPG